MRVVLASNNAKKLAELQGLLQDLPLTLVTQASLGIGEADEPHRSFLENALAKARHAAAASSGPALADDSGLCVEALDGLPGVDSAHIAPCPIAQGTAVSAREDRRRVQDAANNQWLLDRLKPGMARRAHYLCVLVALRRAQDPEPLVAIGRWHGEVLTHAQGEGGFGYDPLMRMDGCSVSVAAMPAADKQRLSHRALAMAALREQLRHVWRVGV